MSISDIISIICAVINLIAIAVIAIVQYKQGKRMEELALKQDKEQQIAKAQRIKAQRDSFIMKYYNDDDEIYLLPLCWISSIYNPAHAYHRKMYMEYNMLEEDVQREICEYMHFSVTIPKNEREAFYYDCVKALESAEYRFNVNNHHKSIYYENAKYLSRAFDRYGSKELPIKLDILERRLTDLLREYNENPRNCPDPLTAFLDEYEFWGCGEHQACELCVVLSKWLAEFSPKEYDENYWVPGEYGYEKIATMEDLFLCSLLCVYLFLIMPKKKGDGDD